MAKFLWKMVIFYGIQNFIWVQKIFINSLEQNDPELNANVFKDGIEFL